MDDQQAHQIIPLPARRRLLKGSFAAPALLTLSSGSALAATSSTCLARATTAPSTKPLFDAGTTTPPAQSSFPDTCMRVQLVTDGATTPTYYLTKASLGSHLVSLAGWTPSTTGQSFDVGGTNANKLTGSPLATTLPTTASRYWVALRFNAAGAIVGVGLSGDGSVVTSSCWTSTRA